MSDNTREMLTKNMQGVRESIEEYVRQIESGEYGDQWTITDTEGNEAVVTARDESAALDKAYDVPANRLLLVGEASDWGVTHESADEPTADDTPISEYPLEIVDGRGKEFAVVLCTGGPHIEVVADGGQSARLAGYWGGEQVYMHGDVFDTFLDYFIERD